MATLTVSAMTRKISYCPTRGHIPHPPPCAATRRDPVLAKFKPTWHASLLDTGNLRRPSALAVEHGSALTTNNTLANPCRADPSLWTKVVTDAADVSERLGPHLYRYLVIDVGFRVNCHSRYAWFIALFRSPGSRGVAPRVAHDIEKTLRYARY